MIFLNAFVDLGHKTIIQNTMFKVYDGEIQIILAAIVNVLIPFILLFALSGYLVDRFRKLRVMVASALVAVGTDECGGADGDYCYHSPRGISLL